MIICPKMFFQILQFFTIVQVRVHNVLKQQKEKTPGDSSQMMDKQERSEND